jgi:phage terminase large subunit-like protein
MTIAVRSAVTAYAEAVLSGQIVVGKLVRLAAERHMRDLEAGHERGLRFDDGAAQHAIDFFRVLRLPDGAGAGGPFALQPWQEFVVGSLFGWFGADGSITRW